MATFNKQKNGKIRAAVFARGRRYSKVLETITLAKRWAAALEAQQHHSTRTSALFYEVLERYKLEVSVGKKSAANEAKRIKHLSRGILGSLRISSISAQHIAKWRDKELQRVKGSSVNRNLNLLSAVFNHARREWQIISSNPVAEIKRPRNPAHRDRLISGDEIQLICQQLKHAETPPTLKIQELAIMFLLAIETACRQGELCGVLWVNVDTKRRTMLLLDTKNGDNRAVPLSSRSIALLGLMAGVNSPCVFSLTAATASALFRKAVQKTDIKDLRFHDARHEAITRLAKKLDVLALARTVGHKDIKQLMTYYNETAEDLARRLD